MAHALITGGTGFVGSHVARLLAQQGHSVRILHRPTSKLDALQGVPFDSALGDVLDEASLRAACEGCDWVFHVAAVADYWRADRAHLMHVNIGGTRAVLRAAREAGVRRVIFTSSAASIGMHADGQLADESMRFNQSPSRFPYAYSKAMAEVVALEAVQTGQDVVIVNPVVVLGPGDLNRISGEFILNINRLGALMPVPGGGVAVTDVRDVARWHVRAAEAGETGQRYILGTANMDYGYLFPMIADVIGVSRPGLPVPDAILSLSAMIVEGLAALGYRAPFDGNQARLATRRVFFAFDKTWSALGSPEVNMRTSVADTFNWYRQHGFL